MIVPLALLGDISCASTRRSFFESFENVEADCFPQKDNRNRRVFLDAKLSTVVLAASRRANAREQGHITVRIYPWNSFGDEHKKCMLGLDELCILDPANLPIPLVDQISWDLCKKMYAADGVKRLGDISDYVVTRGEINQTIFRKFITDDPKHSRLLKGVEIGQYSLKKHLHQGHPEWFDEKSFLAENTERQVVQRQRIATQRITGVDDSLRLVATIIDPPCYFADSTNSIVLTDNAKHNLEYLLALLNSKLFQWRFRLTSTNNNVGTNELECLPVVDMTAPNAQHANMCTRLSALAVAMLSLSASLGSVKSEIQSAAIQRQIDATDAEIDRLVYELYGLTEEEIKIVEGGR